MVSANRFCSSVAAVTPFHFDPGAQFSLAVGRKTVHMWDLQSPALPEALDDYYANVRSNRDQPYRDDFRRARGSAVEPGARRALPAARAIGSGPKRRVHLAEHYLSQPAVQILRGRTCNGHPTGVEPPAPGASRLWDIAHVGYWRPRLRNGYRMLGKARKFASRPSFQRLQITGPKLRACIVEAISWNDGGSNSRRCRARARFVAVTAPAGYRSLPRG